jgi:ArsR family transcriptional regulator
MKDAAEFFKALADESRLNMLWLLMNHRELCVCDVMAALGITQSKASRHLGTLRHAGLVIGRKDGLWSHYSLVSVADPLIRAHLKALKKELAARPEAKKLLAKLGVWFEQKGRSCAGGNR